MAILNKPDMNYGVWAEGGNIEIPSSEKVEQGWIIEKPLNETMNWLQNRQDRMLQYINQRGIPEWDVRTEYPTDAYVTRVGLLYQALSNNKDADPTLNPEIWEVAFVSNSNFIDYSERVDSIENVDGYLKQYVKKSNPVFDAATKGNGYYNPAGLSGFSFLQDKAVITNKGTIIAEFSGGTNPKDVVTHEQLAIALQTFKVGSVYTTTVNENPSITFGYGTWERFARGRTLVGFSDEVSNTIPDWVKMSGREFGEFSHKLSVDELPSHSHKTPQSWGGGGGVTGFERISNWSGHANDNEVDSFGNQVSSKTGGDKPHNNVQPSIVVYFWKRIS